MPSLPPPPEITGPNPMPLDWNERVPRMRELYSKALTQSYNIETELKWEALDPGDFTPEERISLAYWMSCDGTFENSGVPTFAYAMIQAFERHEGDDVAKMLHTISRDEMHHDEICRRTAQTLVPGFPFDFEPKTELEEMAVANMRWVSYINSKYWSSFKSAFDRNRFPTLTTNFILGEAAASLIFMRSAERSEHPFFADTFRKIARDESRHFAFCNYMAQEYFATFDDEEREKMTKRLRAAFIYISIVLEIPRQPFWDVPDGFIDSHLELERLAVQGGLGLPPLEERQDIWKKAALRVKGLTDRAGIAFPALPEVGIEGVETALTEEDLVIVSF